jgi:hypothetical protein
MGESLQSYRCFTVDERGWPKAFKQKVGMPACTHIVFNQDELRTLPILESSFHLPLLDTLELSSPWKYPEYRKRISVLQRIHAKVFKITIDHSHQGLLELLESKDEVEQLELEFSRARMDMVSFLNVQELLASLFVTSRITRKPPCPNMKVLRLRFAGLDSQQRTRLSYSCRERMDERRLAGYSLEQCYIWSHKQDWNEAAPLVLVTENETVRIEEQVMCS